MKLIPNLLAEELGVDRLADDGRVESELMTQIFVGNVPDETSERALRRLFEQHGRVTSVKMAGNGGHGQRRGFAFICMPRFEDAEEAIVRLNGSQLSGRTLTVKEARARKPVAANDTCFRWDLMVP